MTILVSLLFAIAGCLLILLSAPTAPTSTKIMRIGEITYLCGLLVFLLQLSPKVVDLLGR